MAKSGGSGSSKYKGQKIGPRVIVALGEHKGKKFFSRVIVPVQKKLNLPVAKPEDLEVKRGDIVYLKRGSLMDLQYKVLLTELTAKKENVTLSIPIPQGFPLYKLRKLVLGKTGVAGIRTPRGVTHLNPSA